jgi:calcium/calmodulin-dependent protein kinase I
VYLATKKSNGENYAVKVVNKANLAKDDEESLRREAAILTKFSYPNIVKCIDFFEEEKHFYVVLEYLQGGELFDRIVKKTFYSEKEARDLVVIILSAIKYCHDRNIVHRFVRQNLHLPHCTIVPRNRYRFIPTITILCAINNYQGS